MRHDEVLEGPPVDEQSIINPSSRSWKLHGTIRSGKRVASLIPRGRSSHGARLWLAFDGQALPISQVEPLEDASVDATRPLPESHE